MPYQIGTFEKKLLQSYCRPIVHMRSQISGKRFGLILGSGVSRPLGFPNWKELVDRIAQDPDVRGQHLLANVAGLSETSKTQMLFQHFKSKSTEGTGEPVSQKLYRRIHGQWRRIIQRALYKDVADDPAARLSRHPFIGEYAGIIERASMTVNYNFDDTVEQLLSAQMKRSDAYGRNFQTIWNGSLPLQSDKPVIYHPNGYLPSNLLEYPSETVVFSEDTFADQLIQSMAGHHASLLHHLSQTTCLFVGLSLQDATLRHLLRQNSLINPGHYHYYIHYLDKPIDKVDGALQAIADANFEIYNLVTLFLTDSEIASLGRLLNMDEDDLEFQAGEVGAQLGYFFYLTGAIGAGKTTCLSYFGSFCTYAEWTEPSHPLLIKSWNDLSNDERAQVDEWIARQFNLKNFALLKQTSGIHVIDRSPLDPLAFTEKDKLPEKVKFIQRVVGPGSSCRNIRKGQVIFLSGDPDEMEARVVGRNKESKAPVIKEMQERLLSVYSEPLTVIDTTGATVYDVVKRVASAIIREDYRERDLSGLLNMMAGDPSLKSAEKQAP